MPVPRPLRAAVGSDSLVRKAGHTHKEALANRLNVELALQQTMAAKAGLSSLVGNYEEMFRKPMASLDKEERELALDIAIQSDKASETQLDGLVRAMEGEQGYQSWITRRAAMESPAPSTRGLWVSRLKRFSEYLNTEYMTGVSKAQAMDYKEHLLQRLAQSSVRSELSTLKGFWNWALDHGLVTENPWLGLTKKLKDSEKKQIADELTISRATIKATDELDLRYLVMRYTGCRANEASGLRHSDIDLKARTIRFSQWSNGEVTRRLKGGQKDERVVPINDALAAVLAVTTLYTTDEPLFPRSYKPSNQSWGQGWSGSFKDKYGFVSHDLRRRAVTKLAVAGVSPFIIYEITRQRIPGMSDVVSLYVRPTVNELRAAMEHI